MELRTGTRSIEHQVSCSTVAEAPEDGGRAERDDCGERIAKLWRGAGEEGVVGGRRPDVLCGDGCLPECQRVGDPVREEYACAFVSATKGSNFVSDGGARAMLTEKEGRRADRDAHADGHGGHRWMACAVGDCECVAVAVVVVDEEERIIDEGEEMKGAAH